MATMVFFTRSAEGPSANKRVASAPVRNALILCRRVSVSHDDGRISTTPVSSRAPQCCGARRVACRAGLYRGRHEPDTFPQVGHGPSAGGNGSSPRERNNESPSITTGSHSHGMRHAGDSRVHGRLFWRRRRRRPSRPNRPGRPSRSGRS